jgi:hypothetical protein
VVQVLAAFLCELASEHFARFSTKAARLHPGLCRNL